MLSSFQYITPQSIAEDPAVIKFRANDSDRKRRSHRKSRNGCIPCKERHLKCDEQQPGCGQCLHGKRPCIYTIPLQSDIPTHVTRAPSPSKGSLKPEAATVLLNELSSESHHRGADSLELLYHFFHTTDSLWMGATECQALLQQHSPRLAIGSPFLLHAMLSFSAYHIATLFPEQRRYATAGTWHYGLALQLYRRAITDEIVNTDALFSCCLLLTLLSFMHLSNDPHIYDDPKSPKSLTVDTVSIHFISGPRIISDALASRALLKESLWKPLMYHCENYPFDEGDTLADFPLASRSMAGLKARCCGDNIGGPFDTALASLKILMQSYVSKKRNEMVEFTFCFAIRLDARFLHFVEERAPNALLVLCYWYALVAQVDQWWAYPTAQIEGMKLFCYLRNTADPSIQELLNLPANLLNIRSSVT